MEVFGQFSNVCQGKIPVTTQDHCSQVTTGAQDAGQIRRAHSVLGHQMLEDIQPGDFWTLDVLGVLILDERTEQVEVVTLVRREILVP